MLTVLPHEHNSSDLKAVARISDNSSAQGDASDSVESAAADTVDAAASGTVDPAADPVVFRGPSRLLIFVALGVVALAVAAVAILANYFQSQPATDPNAALVVGAVDQPGQVTASCKSLDAALPNDLAGLARRELLVQEAGVAGWGPSPDAVVYRCGLADPVDLTCSSALVEFNGVAWLPLPGTDSTTYVAADRPVRVALTVNNSIGVGPVQALSNVVRDVLEKRDICQGGALIPPEGP